MIRQFTCMFALLSAPLFANEGWFPVKGDDLAEMLNDTVWDYGSAWQEFYVSGRTNYNAGRDSWGYWEVRDGEYCSQWPPADGWACYRVEMKQDGDQTQIKFVGDSGDETKGYLRQ